MRPNIKNAYSEKFERQLEKALKGYAPWKQTGEMFRQKAMAKKPVTDPQWDKLAKLGIKEIPANCWEASELIDAAIGKLSV